MALLGDVLKANGGHDLWRQLRRFTVHMSISGALFDRRCGSVSLRDLVVEGCTQEQSVEIIGFASPDRRALYRPDRVALEGSDGQLLKERRAASAEFRNQMQSTTWDELQLAHYCGYLIWNYVNVPFILADGDMATEELEPITSDAETWHRLKVQFPSRVVTHSSEQTFYFDREGRLRRLDYALENGDPERIAQLFSDHQRFSEILLPTLCRLLKIGVNGALIAKPAWVDIEIFDAVFE